MATFWDRVTGLHAQEQTEAHRPRPDVLSEQLQSQKTYSAHMKSLETLTALSSEDVVLESVRFANRHKEAFRDFIYKGDALHKASRQTSPDQLSAIIVMMFFLGILIALIVVLSGR
jgi:hypothetical protein